MRDSTRILKVRSKILKYCCGRVRSLFLAATAGSRGNRMRATGKNRDVTKSWLEDLPNVAH